LHPRSTQARQHYSISCIPLLDLTDNKSFTTNLGKGILNETHPTFVGVYNGIVSYPGVAQAIESSDLVINTGPLLSDSNTGGFTRFIKPEHVVEIHSDHVIFKGQQYLNVAMKSCTPPSSQPNQVLNRLINHINGDKLPKVTKPELPAKPVPQDHDSKKIVQSWIWDRIGQFLKPGDILLAESGTAQFGMPDASFPENITYITQQFYSSIGYSVGGCLGAALALREKKKGAKVEYMPDGGLNNQGPGRVILIVGDGSLQMTVQEIGTMVKAGLTPIMYFLLL
jgi:pyruvate decarboxylase